MEFDSLAGRVRRADVFAFLFLVMGLDHLLVSGAAFLAGDHTLPVVARTTVGCFAVGAAALAVRRPVTFRRGDEAASRPLLALAGVAAVAFTGLLALRVL